MTSFIQSFRSRQQIIILMLMLETLHFSIWLEFGSPLSRSLMLVHLGIFLIWQPVWRGDEKLAWYNGLLFIVMTAAFVTWMNWLMLFCWLILLIGFCGGRVTIQPRERFVNVIVLVFLVSELLIAVTISLFAIEISGNVSYTFRLFLPFLPVMILPLSTTGDGRSLHTVDLIHAMTTALLVSLLVIGSLLIMYRSGTDYLVALVQTLIAIGLLLFVISWLLTPHAGFSGFTQLWMRSILNIGTPLEHWLEQIANLFEQQNSPEEFLGAVLDELLTLPWVTGTSWKNATSEGHFGEMTQYQTQIRTDNLVIYINSHMPIGGALFLHCKLLVQIIDIFYEAKIREKKLTQQTHLQAIYETGARVTHDIKNLLQSLHAITSISGLDGSDAPGSLSRQLLEKQLPHLTQRLQLALDKLQAPQTASPDNIYLEDWWQAMKARNNQTSIEFQSEISENCLIPAELFDSVSENLLENLKDKAKVETTLRITVYLHSGRNYLRLRVCDNGSRIPDEKATRVFREPLKSHNGLGIGLYQAGRHAESMGYQLLLQHNREGQVCFELSRKPSARAAGAD